MMGEEIRTYHGQPVLKEPVWAWEIPCYFFTGGLAGASAGLAYMSQLRGNDVLARRAWAISLLGVGASPTLLISDLGKPERFLNMLRMFKPTSPMSVGSWILSGSGAFTGLAAANAWTGRFGRSAKLARPAAALLGLPLSTYTAALIANTAVPVWHEARRFLPFVFGAGAALSAGAAAVAITPPENAAAARRVALAAALVEGIANELMRQRLGEHGEPYKRAPASQLGAARRACVIAGSALLARRGRASRPSRDYVRRATARRRAERPLERFQSRLREHQGPEVCDRATAPADHGRRHPRRRPQVTLSHWQLEPSQLAPVLLLGVAYWMRAREARATSADPFRNFGRCRFTPGSRFPCSR